jgi:hypothetical protein
MRSSSGRGENEIVGPEPFFGNPLGLKNKIKLMQITLFETDINGIFLPYKPFC